MTDASGRQPTTPVPQLTTEPVARRARIWPRKVPARIGRARTSTVVLAVLFLGLFVLWIGVRPANTDGVPATPASSTTGVEQPAPTTEPPATTSEPAPTSTAEETTTTPRTTTSRPTTTAPTTTTDEDEPTSTPTTTAPERTTAAPSTTRPAPTTTAPAPTSAADPTD